MRVEKNQDIKEVKEELAKTKRELSGQIKRETRKSHPVLTCLIIVVAVILLGGGWVVSLVAKTGMWEIPVFTDVFYEVPAPTREVIAEGDLDEVLTEELTDLVNERVQEIGGADIDRSLSINLEETVLSAALPLLSQDSEGMIGDKAQVAALEDTGLEVFLPLAKSELNTAVMLDLVPYIDEDSSLQVDVNQLRLGQLKFPTWLVNLVLRRPLSLASWELNREISKYAELESVTVYEGYINLSGELTMEIISL